MKPTLVGTALAVLSLHMPAAVLVYDGFTNYSDPLGLQNGGTGFGSSWQNGPVSNGGTDAVSSSATLNDGNLDAPSGYVFQSGSSSGSDVNGSHIDLTGGAIRNLGSNRIDLGTDQTRYFSFLFNQSGSGSGGVLNVAFLSSSTLGRRIWESGTSSSSMSLDFGNDSSSAGGVGFTAGSDSLVVGKLVSSAAGVDTVSLSLWDRGSSISGEPMSWDLSGTVEVGDQDAVINRVYLTGGNNGNFDRVDEFIIGNSFADVTGVIPEPSTFALLAMAMLGLLFQRRR